MSPFKNIPGFGSGVWWKSGLALLFYAVVFLFVITVVNPSAPPLTLDLVAPTNKSSVSLSGETHSQKPVYLLENNQQLQSAKSDSGGKFFFALNNLRDGNYAYTIEVCSSETKAKCSSQNILITIDQTPPLQPSVVFPSGLPDDSDSQIAIKGTAELNSKIIVQAGEDGALQKVTPNEKGEFGVNTALVLGTNTISVKAVDEAGNESQAAVTTFDFNPPKYKAKVARVIDGDTVKLETGEVVRYIGIDTPETVHPTKPVQCYGKEASDKNQELVEGKEIKLEKDVSETDKYNRLLRYIWIGETLVNELLVKEGYAHSSTYPPDVKYQDKFIAAERQAREEKRGLWADVCTGAIPTQPPTPIPTQPKPISPSQNTYPTLLPTSIPTSISQPTQPSSGGYTCNCSKTCPQMSSCDEAQYQLNVCGCKARDADHDGIACDADCQ